MPWPEMIDVSLDGVAATWLDGGDKRALRASFEAEIADITPPSEALA
jgi:hypothetical protein